MISVLAARNPVPSWDKLYNLSSTRRLAPRALWFSPVKVKLKCHLLQAAVRLWLSGRGDAAFLPLDARAGWIFFRTPGPSPLALSLGLLSAGLRSVCTGALTSCFLLLTFYQQF